MESKIKDIKLAPSGHDKINWVKNFMPVMKAINDEYSVSKPFAGKRMVMTMHLEAKTAYLAIVLKMLGRRLLPPHQTHYPLRMMCVLLWWSPG